jgi:hypothetical protein
VNIKDRPAIALKSLGSLEAGLSDSGNSPRYDCCVGAVFPFSFLFFGLNLLNFSFSRSVSPARENFPDLPIPVVDSKSEEVGEKSMDLPQLPQIPEFSIPLHPLPQPPSQQQLTHSDSALLVSPRSRPQPPPKPMPKPKPAVLPKPTNQQPIAGPTEVAVEIERPVVPTPIKNEEITPLIVVAEVIVSNNNIDNSNSEKPYFPLPQSPFANLKPSLSDESTDSSDKSSELKRKLSQNQILMHKQHLISKGKHRPSIEQQQQQFDQPTRPKAPNVDNDGNIFLLTNSLRNVTLPGRERKHTIFQNGTLEFFFCRIL